MLERDSDSQSWGRRLKQAAGKVASEGDLSTMFINMSLEGGDGGYQNTVRGRVRNNGKEDSSGFATFGLSFKEIREHN